MYYIYIWPKEELLRKYACLLSLQQLSAQSNSSLSGRGMGCQVWNAITCYGFLVFWDSALSRCSVSTPPKTLFLKLRGGVGGKGGAEWVGKGERMIRREICSETNLIEYELCRDGK